MFREIPFYKWWLDDYKMKTLNIVEVAEAAWDESEKQNRRAVLTELAEEIKWRIDQNRKIPETEYGKGCLDSAQTILALINKKLEAAK